MALEAFVNGKKKKKAKKVGETLRLEVNLVLSSEEQSNEFFYPVLVEERTDKQNSSEGTEADDVVDPFGEDANEQAKLAAIARSFEEKYGPGTGPKKKKRKLQDLDLIDRGHGYDITDSFVDDSELYEDFVPPQVETALGGFYINTGQLDFKCRTDLDPEEADFVLKKKKPKLKKNLSHHKILASQKLKKAKQAALFKTPSKSGKKLLAGSGVSPLVKQAKVKPEKKLKKSKLTFSSSPATSLSSSESSTTASNLAVPIGVGGITVPVFDPATSALSQVETSLGALPTLDATDEAPPPPKEPPILPESLLPPDVLTKVKDLEETIRWDQGNGKKLSLKTRSGYDEKLVEIELLCKAVNMKIRNAVFEFLAYKMGVAKGTLTKRMKAVLKKREDDELEEPLRKLKMAVEESMPAQIAEYEEAKRTESVSSATDRALEVDDETKMEDVFDDSVLSLPGSSQVVGGASAPGTPLPQEGGASKAKKVLIRKKYKWTDEIRKLLCDVVRIKVESEERINRITRGSGDEIIGQFLEEKVKPFWPKGWMQKSVLMKMSEVAHKHFTNPQPKKAVVPKKEKPTTVKKEPVDSKSTTIPILPKTPPATISSSVGVASLLQTSKSISAPSTPSQRSLPTDPKELVAFLLKDDNLRSDEKTKELLKKVVLSHGVKLIKEKQARTAQLANKPNIATTSTAVNVTATCKQLTKLHTTKPVMVAQSAKPIAPVTVGVVQSVSSKPRVVISSSVPALSASKLVDPKSSPPKASGITLSGSTTSPSATQPSVVKTGSGLSGLMTRVSTPSPPKAEKKKERKKKVAKDSPSLPASLANSGALKNSTVKAAAGSNPPHMLTSTAGLTGLPGVLQYISSSGSPPVIKVITKAAGTLQPAQPASAAPTTIITTSDGRLLLTGASQSQVSITQANFNSGKSIPSQSSEGAKPRGVDGSGTGLLKMSGSTDSTSSRSVVGGALSFSPGKQLKTTPVIQIPRVSSIPARVSSNSLNQPSSPPNTAVLVSKSTPPAPRAPPPLATITSIKPAALDEAALLTHPQQLGGKAVIASSQPLKRLKLETLSSATGQREQDLKHKKAPVAAKNDQQTVLKTVTATTTATIPLVQPAQAVVPLTGATTFAQVISQPAPENLSVPSLPKLISSSSRQGGRPVVKLLPLAGTLPETTTNASIRKDVPPLTSNSYRVIHETPPLSTTPLKESSPLKSPVEQIMEEHSYLGSSHSCSSPPVQPAGQNPWLARTSSPEKQLQLQSGENVLQSQHAPKGPSAYAKDQ